MVAKDHEKILLVSRKKGNHCSTCLNSKKKSETMSARRNAHFIKTLAASHEVGVLAAKPASRLAKTKLAVRQDHSDRLQQVIQQAPIAVQPLGANAARQLNANVMSKRLLMITPHQ